MLKMKVNPIVNEEGLDIQYEKTQKYSHQIKEALHQL